MSNLKQWLERLGLGQYAQVFAENDIDFEVLPRLTEDNLKELGHFGATAIGPKSVLIDCSDRTRNTCCVIFNKSKSMLPPAAFVLTRVIPLQKGITA